ncbi:MAG: VOC family protein [Euryarchaeota archaeon]|nr:VOC family protein [Euryarchaeota archaeon]
MSDAHLGHVHLKVTDLDRAVEFYTGLLDLAVTERHASFAFLSFGDHHHDLALQAHKGASSPPPQSTGLYHVAFELDALAAVGDAYEWLADREITVSPVDHGISKAIYFDDPDGNGVELYVDTRETGDERWNGENSRFDPARI